MFFYEHLNLLVCYVMLTDTQSLTFRKSVVSSLWGQAVQEDEDTLSCFLVIAQLDAQILFNVFIYL